MLCLVRSPLLFALGALALLLVALEVARPGFFLHDDNATWFAGAYALDFRTLTQTGDIAEVNFFQYGGEPFLEQGQSGVLYPPVYVAAALAQVVTGDLRWTIEWLAALHLALAVGGFYFWLRRGGVDAWLAALGGLAWALNPFVLILGASWIFVTYVVAGLPWLFWAVDVVILGSLRGPCAGRGGEGEDDPRSWRADSPAEGDLIRGPSTALGSASAGKRDVSPRSAQDDDLLEGGLRRGDPAGGGPEPRLRKSPGPAQGLRGLPIEGEADSGMRASPSPAQGLRGLPWGAMLGIIAGLFVLQGYVQWAAYAFLFAGIYAAFRIYVDARGSGLRGERGGEGEPGIGSRKSPNPAQGLRRLPLLAGALVVAGLMALALALPLVLPMAHAVAESKVRAQPLSLMQELFYRVEWGDLLAAQVGIFRPHFLFDASTALFFCPALVLFPVAMVSFARGDAAVRRRLFPLMVLAVLALLVSGSGYLLLNILPLMQKFRWPFKIFVFAEFFFMASLVWGLAGWGGRRTPGDGGRDFGEGDSRLQSAGGTAETKLVRGPSTALGPAAVGKGDVSPRFAQDDDLLGSGLRRGEPAGGGPEPGLRKSSSPVPGGRGVPIEGEADSGGRASPSPAQGLRGLPFEGGPDSGVRSSPSPAAGGRGVPVEGEADSGGRASPSPAQGLRGLPWGAMLLLGVVIVLQVGVALVEHDSNFLSRARLPVSEAGLPAGMDPARGRVIAVDDEVPVAEGDRFFTHAYGTWFQVPSLGGYNPLVSAARLEFGMGLDVPNVFHGPITPEVRAAFEDRAVRYWVVRSASPLRAEIDPMAGMKVLAETPGRAGDSDYTSGADRTIYEDMEAKPVAFVGAGEARSPLGLAVRYAGNSMLIQLGGAAGTAAVSIGPTDGWWARVDGGAWQKPEYRGFRLYLPVSEKNRELEVRYFDSRLRAGLCYSLAIMGLLVMIALICRLVPCGLGRSS